MSYDEWGLKTPGYDATKDQRRAYEQARTQKHFDHINWLLSPGPKYPY